MLDLVFTVGQYHLVSMALNTFRVERDDGVTGVADSRSLSNTDARFDVRAAAPRTRACRSRSDVTTVSDAGIAVAFDLVDDAVVGRVRARPRVAYATSTPSCTPSGSRGADGRRARPRPGRRSDARTPATRRSAGGPRRPDPATSRRAGPDDVHRVDDQAAASRRAHVVVLRPRAPRSTRLRRGRRRARGSRRRSVSKPGRGATSTRGNACERGVARGHRRRTTRGRSPAPTCRRPSRRRRSRRRCR